MTSRSSCYSLRTLEKPDYRALAEVKLPASDTKRSAASAQADRVLYVGEVLERDDERGRLGYTTRGLASGTMSGRRQLTSCR